MAFHSCRPWLHPYLTLLLGLSHIILVKSIPEPELEYRAKNFPPEALRAISKTRTKSCASELAQFVDERVRQPFHGLDLKGSCPSINDHIPRQIGCLSAINETQFDVAHFGHPLDNTSNQKMCLQFCFSRGYSFASHRQSDMSCHCSNQLDTSNLLSDIASSDCKLSGALALYRVSPSYSHSTQPKRLEHPKEMNPIKIAFLLSLNGRSILQIGRLLKMIYAEQHLYYIHVDVRQQYLFNKLLPLESLKPNVILAKHRLNTIWGGSTLLRMILNSMAILTNHRWDYLINLSESDLPLKTIPELENYLASHSRSTIYLRAHNMTGDKFIRKQGLDQWFYQCENRMWRLGKRQLHYNLRYSGGSDWLALPRDFCDTILREAGDPTGLVGPLLLLFNYTLLPAESFFHTVALNTEFCDKLVDNNLRMTNWRKDRDCGCQHKQVVDWCGCSPRIYRWSDLKRLQRTKSAPSIFFSRKFDPTVSSSIIGAVEQHLINKRELSALHLDTRYWLNVWEAGDQQLESSKLDTYAQFGLLALSQIIENEDGRRGLLLRSLDLFFNEDRFEGVLLQYCGEPTSCHEFLVARNTSTHLGYYNFDCFNEETQRQLKVIEVNKEFDTGERIFRNYMPLIAESDLVVYHEWLFNFGLEQGKTIKNTVKFKWISPRGESRLDQDVKLSAKIEQPHLYLAHKMNVAGRLDSGIWHLEVYDKSNQCLDYRFLVFNETSFDLKSIEQHQFDQFYHVTQACSIDGTRFQHCNATNWSSQVRDAKLATYDLI